MTQELIPLNRDVDTTSKRKQQTGNALKLHDAEMKLINSGPLGMRRLANARSLDIQEKFPDIAEGDADKMGAGYVVLKIMRVSGELTEQTKYEVTRLNNKAD